MARVVVLGAGISGHTAALHLRRLLGKQHEVVVVSPNSQWNWIPSNIWVGVGRMSAKDVTFKLAPVYKKKGIDYRQAKAVALWPDGDETSDLPKVEVEWTSPDKAVTRERITYDYLINATGPKLNFGATPGLGPDGRARGHLGRCAQGARQSPVSCDRTCTGPLRQGQGALAEEPFPVHSTKEN